MTTQPSPTIQEQDEHRSPAKLLQDIILEKTDNGRLIVDFLISAMNGELKGFQPCHQLQAARLLERFGLEEAKTFIAASAHLRPTRRERRDERRADRRINAEYAQIVREQTDNGRTIVNFLIQAMEGELDDFKPCHRMSAAKELIHRGFDELPQDIEDEAEEQVQEPDPAAEERRRRREEAVEFSLHGPLYYAIYPYPCSCEDRLHDCKGNELSEEERAKAATLAPAERTFIHDSDELDDYIARYAEYLTRLNPGKHIDINAFRWRKDNHDP